MRMVLAVMAIVLAFAAPALAAKVTLQGDVTYRERIALPPGGVLTVSLVDLAAPVPPRVSAKAAIAGPGQVPLTFNLNFEDSVILPGHQYAIVAEISGPDGALWFRNAEPYAVDPLAPAAPVLVIVNRAPQVAEPAEEQPAAPAVPDATETPVAALPLIVDSTWEARTIAGNPVAHGVISSLNIASDMRAGGRGGCNSWFAQAELSDNVLIFSAVAATRMACLSEEANAQETSFFAALAATRFWRLDGKQLALLDAAGAELAVLDKSRF